MYGLLVAMLLAGSRQAEVAVNPHGDSLVEVPKAAIVPPVSEKPGLVIEERPVVKGKGKGKGGKRESDGDVYFTAAESFTASDKEAPVLAARKTQSALGMEADGAKRIEAEVGTAVQRVLEAAPGDWEAFSTAVRDAAKSIKRLGELVTGASEDAKRSLDKVLDDPAEDEVQTLQAAYRVATRDAKALAARKRRWNAQIGEACCAFYAREPSPVSGRLPHPLARLVGQNPVLFFSVVAAALGATTFGLGYLVGTRKK